MKFTRKHYVFFRLATSVLLVAFLLGGIFKGIVASSGFSPIISNLLGQLTPTPYFVANYNDASSDNGDVSPPVAQGFNTPLQTSVDAVNHRLFVTDCVNNRVLVFNLDSSNIPLDFIADFVLGQTNFNSSSSGLTASTFSCPYGVSYDSINNRLFVSDQANFRVLVFDTTVITNGMSAVNVLGQVDFTTSTQVLDASATYDPYGVFYDNSNNYLYVSQYSASRVTVFDVAPGSIVNNEDAIHVFGQVDFNSNNQGLSINGLDRPYGVVHDNNLKRLFISDTYNNRIVVYDTTNMKNDNPLLGPDALYVIGQVDFNSEVSATSQTQFNAPTGLALDVGAEILFVADSSNNRILTFSIATDGTTEAVHVLGQQTFSTGNSGTSISTFHNPVGIAIDDSNHLYITDVLNNRVIIHESINVITDGQDAFSELGHTSTLYTFGATPVYTAMYENSTPATYVNPYGFVNPSGVALDKVHHRLFVADGGNSRVLVFNLSVDNEINDYQADYVLGQSSFYTNTSGTTQNQFGGVNALAYDSVKDYLYVGDTANKRILVFDARDAGSSAQTICGTTTTTGLANNMNASCVLGQPNFTSNSIATTSTGMGATEQLEVDTNNNRLFVSDYTNGRVLVFNTASLTNGMAATNVLGQADFTTTPTTLSQNKMIAAIGVAYDAEAELLYVSEGNNFSANRVLVFDVNPATITNGENALHVLGQTNFTNNNTGTTSALFSFPGHVALDSVNKILFVSDINNHRILTFDVTSIIDGESAVGVVGQDNFVSADSTVNQYSSNNAYGLVFDTNTQRFFFGTGDDSAHRVAQIDFAKIPTQTLPSASVGGPYSQTITVTSIQGSSALSLVSGTLPPGLTLGASSLSGTPTTAGTYTFTLRVVDTVGVSTFYSNQREFSLVVGGVVVGGPILCTDTTATNYGAVGTCTYPPPAETCATNPSLCPPPPPPTCTDTTATNYGAVGTCTYPPPAETCATNPSLCPPPPPPPTCAQLGTCPVTPPAETCATNPSLCPVVTPPSGGGGGSTLPPTVTVAPSSIPPSPSPFSSVTTKAITLLALIAGLLGTIFATPFSFSELILLPSRLWSLFLAIFGIKKRARPWGTVYDAITKQPLDPAYVSLFDMAGKEIATSITDLDGRYGFLVPPGTYRLEAKKTNYLFPSKKLVGKVEDELYKDLYFGEKVIIETDGQVITQNIPMDPEKFDWNEMAKRNQKLMRFYSKYDKLILTLSDIFFIVGFVVATAALIFAPQPYNIVIFGLYVLLAIIKETGVNPRKLSKVADKNHNPLPFAIVRMYRAAINQEVAHKVTTERGQFYCLIPNGTYYLTVERKNADQTYTKVHQSLPFEVKKGVVKLKIIV